MKYILSRKEMQTIDERTQEKFCVPSLVLMERAALAVCEEVEAEANNLVESVSNKNVESGKLHIVSVCGSGNNGGDGLACARILYTKGYSCTVLFVGDEEHMTPSCKAQMDAVRAYSIPVTSDPSCLTDADIIIDAVFGIGLNRPLSEKYSQLFTLINNTSAIRIAVDIPSGIDTDTGNVWGNAIKCHSTVTFNYAKLGHVLYPGADYIGKLVISDVGITKHSAPDEFHPVKALEKDDFNLLPVRIPNGHKGTFGKVLVVAGSEEICGAAILAAKAALHIGCGMVKVFTHENNRSAINSSFPEAMVSVYNSSIKDRISEKLNNDIQWADVILCGPGIGTTEIAETLVSTVLSADKPLVLDADALNVISENNIVLSAFGEKAREKGHPIIITPHVVEFSRLTGLSVSDILSDPVHYAVSFQKQTSLITVLKDARTVVAVSEEESYINLSGNEGMGTAGSGDVLSGIIAGILAQNKNAAIAAPLGVFLHGYLGDAAKKRTSSAYMTASTLIDMIPYLEGDKI